LRPANGIRQLDARRLAEVDLENSRISVADLLRMDLNRGRLAGTLGVKEEAR